MKACVITGVQEVIIKDFPEPQLQPGWIIAKVEAMGICGTDVEIYTGALPYLKSGIMKYPVVPGHEWIGKVAAVGAGVTGLAIGDRITGETHIGCGACAACLNGCYNQCPTLQRVGIGGLPGAFAEYITLPVKAVHSVPPEILNLDAILLEPASVVHYALSKVGFHGGERVVIFGPGNLGLLAISLAKTLGAREVVLVGTEESRLQIGRALGADVTLNINQDYQRVTSELTESADVVLEASGSIEAFPVAVSTLRKGGTLCLVSLYKYPITQFDINKLVTYNIKLKGSLGSPGIWEQTIRLLKIGRIKTRGLVTHCVPFESAVEAFRIAQSRSENAIKVAITW
jgi:2-desacetyl-2-hydroxyethyl bacteriochlorophyllide A dehydrogenase